MKYGTDPIPYLAPKIWSIIPEAIKKSKFLESFKPMIRKRKPECPFRLYKAYLKNVGFICPCSILFCFVFLPFSLKMLHFSLF